MKNNVQSNIHLQRYNVFLFHCKPQLLKSRSVTNELEEYSFSALLFFLHKKELSSKFIPIYAVKHTFTNTSQHTRGQ